MTTTDGKVIRSKKDWVSDLRRTHKGVTQRQAEEIYEKVKPFKVIKPKSATSASKANPRGRAVRDR